MNTPVATPVRGSFEWQGRTFQTYWNGKDYNGTKYITATAPTGSEARITASLTKGLSVNKAHSFEFAQAAYQSITGEEW